MESLTLSLSLIFLLISLTMASLDQTPQYSGNCHPWSFYNATRRSCQCYGNPGTSDLKCARNETWIRIRSCMTTDEDGTFFGICETFLFYNRSTAVVVGNYLKLPNNISELNDYMCTPMNRKGKLCSKCIDGFAPSVTSIGYECSNCTNSWYYSVPLYLFLEFVPVTVIYVAIFVFEISVTSAPMTCYVVYAQLLVSIFTRLSKGYLSLESSHAHTAFLVIITLHGVWNLDFFRYVVPPFCISPRLKNIHVVILGYVSAFYPLLLVVLTWVSISFLSRINRTSICKCNCPKKKKDPKSKLIEIFATIFFLSYTKLCLTSMSSLQFTDVYQANNSQVDHVLYSDPSVSHFQNEHIPLAICALVILLTTGILPALLVALYPVRIFRSCIFRWVNGNSRAALNIFLETFYSCYRDGLDGGRDMRSFAAFYLILRMLTFSWFSLPYLTILFGASCLLIALVRPYKRKYMNNGDVLILAFLTLFTYLSHNYKMSFQLQHAEHLIYLWSMAVIASLPLMVVFSNILLQKCPTSTFRRFCFIKDEENSIRDTQTSDDNQHDLDRMLHPQKYSERANSESSERNSLVHKQGCAVNCSIDSY